MKLEVLSCPLCGKKMSSVPVAEAGNKTALCYDDCLRKCSNCQVGYSNGQTKPTLIFKDHRRNVPECVRAHLDKVLSKSLNKLNRDSKRIKFGYNTSEDALTWTIFRYAQLQNNLPTIIEDITGQSSNSPINIYFWGVPLNSDGSISKCKYECLLKALNKTGEDEQLLSEPDIILEDENSLIIFEVKFNSSNDKQKYSKKWDKYYHEDYFNQPFRDNDKLREYQLLRNWFIGNELSTQINKKFYLVNLVLKDTKKDDLVEFKKAIKQTDKAIFMRKDKLSLKNWLVNDYPDWLTERLDKKTKIIN